MVEKTNKKNKPDMVEEFTEEYAEAMVRAREAAETTATAKWQAIYTGFKAANLAGRTALAGELASIAASMRGDIVPGEESRKALGDTRKNLVAFCEADDAFEAYTVGPVKGTVDECDRIIRDWQYKAQTAPELTRGNLVERMVDACAAQPKVRWNAKVGVVTIHEVAAA